MVEGERTQSTRPLWRAIPHRSASSSGGHTVGEYIGTSCSTIVYREGWCVGGKGHLTEETGYLSLYTHCQLQYDLLCNAY